MKSIIFTLIYLWIFSVQINAQIADSLTLKKIVVTASKVETTERLTTKVVDIISRDEIRRSGANDVSQLLQQRNGLLINGANSNPGKDKAVYLRGAGSQYSVILIDGYPVSDPSSEGGALDLRLLSLANIERVEIVKGSMSTLYGSDAIAGVINIITRKSTNEEYSISGRTSFGSYNDQNYELGISGTLSGVGYSINGSIRDIEGISDAAKQAKSTLFDNDGFSQNSFSATFDIPLINGLSFQPIVNGSNFEGKYDNGAFTDADNTFKSTFLNFGSKFQFDENDYSFKGVVTYTETEREFIDAFGSFNPSAQLLNADIFGYYNFEGGHRLLAGFNHQKLDYQLGGLDAGNSIFSPYVSTFLTSDIGLIAELGFRVNQHSEFGSNITYNLAPVFNVNESVKMLISYSTGFKSPTLNELFGPFGSNPLLKPQKSATFDIGGKLYLFDDQLQVQATYFARDVEDLILYAGFETGYVNSEEQNDKGVELMIEWLNPIFELSTFYNYLDGSRITDTGSDDNLLRRPRHNIGFTANKNLKTDLSISISGEYIGERTDLFFNPTTFVSTNVQLEAYMLINATINYSFKRFNVFVNLKNLLNVDYFEVYGYSTPGSNYRAGIQFDI